ncbi:MAG: hypothetical protein OWU84_14005 [Firmicutes bacterium]|nr:hypothetical protein [Bacillota bacterium]
MSMPWVLPTTVWPLPAVKRFPAYGVLWTGNGRTNPVVFYEVRTPASYHQLTHYLTRHPDWHWSFNWSRRRFMDYQRELERQGTPWLWYRETSQGWRLVSPVHPESLEEMAGASPRVAFQAHA